MTLHFKRVAACAVISLFALAGCDSNRTAETSNTQNRELGSAQKTEERTQILEKETTTENAGELGKHATGSGEARIEGKQVTVEKRTENLNESIPTVVSGIKKADINRMDKADFVALGLSDKAADSIIQHREKNGNFRSVDELGRVAGIDSSWLSKNMNKLGVGGNVEAGGEAAEK